jgi:CPA1 family monovalent cation:H+ antiporter
MHENLMLMAAAVLGLGFACQYLAWRARLPAILFLLACGVVVGPATGWLRPEALLGDLLFPFISLAVAVILFEGSVTLRFADIAGLGPVIRNLITIGVLVSWVVTAVATRLAVGFSWELAALFGAIMTVTGPTVVAPLIRTVRPTANVSGVLVWEGILVDPIGATLAVLTYQFIVAEGMGEGLGAGAAAFAGILAVGLALGLAAGQLFGVALRRFWIPKYLHNVAALAMVCGVFGLSDGLSPESGLLAVTVMGVRLANMELVDLEDILAFKESLSLVLLSTLFILLAARMDLAAFQTLGWAALAVPAAIQFLARPIGVQLSALGSPLTSGERHLLAWIGPRGIVAAAVSALFALKLAGTGHPSAASLAPLAFVVIVGTILLQSFTAAPLARRLGVAAPEPKGFLVVGANPVATAVAAELLKNGLPVLLAGQDRNQVRAAAMLGLPTYWGNPASDHADGHLNLAGIGGLMAITPEPERNALAAHYFRHEFDPGRVYSVRVHHPQSGRPAAKSTFRFAGRWLFGEEVSYDELEARIAGGETIKTTTLTPEFSYEAYLEQQGSQRLSLFAVDPAGVLHVLGTTPDPVPKTAWKILSLGPARPAAEAGDRAAG